MRAKQGLLQAATHLPAEAGAAYPQDETLAA